jgi:hypothetical protein
MLFCPVNSLIKSVMKKAVNTWILNPKQNSVSVSKSFPELNLLLVQAHSSCSLFNASMLDCTPNF